MQIVLAVIVIVGMSLLVVGSIRGKVRLKSCCSVADPRQDLRMRAAFDGDRAEAPDGIRTNGV